MVTTRERVESQGPSSTKMLAKGDTFSITHVVQIVALAVTMNKGAINLPIPLPYMYKRFQINARTRRDIEQNIISTKKKILRVAYKFELTRIRNTVLKYVSFDFVEFWIIVPLFERVYFLKLITH